MKHKITLKNLVYWICGFQDETVKYTKEVHLNQLIDMHETPKEKLFCNINAVILMALTGFLWAFFNDFKKI